MGFIFHDFSALNDYTNIFRPDQSVTTFEDQPFFSNKNLYTNFLILTFRPAIRFAIFYFRWPFLLREYLFWRAHGNSVILIYNLPYFLKIQNWTYHFWLRVTFGDLVATFLWWTGQKKAKNHTQIKKKPPLNFRLIRVNRIGEERWQTNKHPIAIINR